MPPGPAGAPGPSCITKYNKVKITRTMELCALGRAAGAQGPGRGQRRRGGEARGRHFENQRGGTGPPAEEVVTMAQCYYNETIGFFYNNSGKELSSHWRPKDVVVVALGLTVSVLVLLTNLLIIAAIASNRRFHQPIYYLLGNLAAADLFAGVAYLFLMFHTGPRTARLSLQGWFVRQGLLDTSLTASVATLLAIAVERHRSVMAVQLHSRLPRGRVVMLIVGVWAAALGLGLLPAHSWHCLCALDRCSRMAPLLSRSYLAVWALSSLLVFLLMVAVYTRIFFYVRRRVQRMAEHVSCHPRYRETTLSLVKTVVIILDLHVEMPRALATVHQFRKVSLLADKSV
ncbi:lysophosphatidic acid receptor 2 isoform X3 [Myotis myotis]|uniref:lysophosphatidic acid receptor 2 isoform X3 n=1 Tax=Myotis myotis TaxID=51298 RepID=UPI00174981D3|nr:lysophosphatidic acid receptor 2 isoform X3 [Myotis myotis]